MALMLYTSWSDGPTNRRMDDGSMVGWMHERLKNPCQIILRHSHYLWHIMLSLETTSSMFRLVSSSSLSSFGCAVVFFPVMFRIKKGFLHFFPFLFFRSFRFIFIFIQTKVLFIFIWFFSLFPQPTQGKQPHAHTDRTAERNRVDQQRQSERDEGEANSPRGIIGWPCGLKRILKNHNYKSECKEAKGFSSRLRSRCVGSTKGWISIESVMGIEWPFVKVMHPARMIADEICLVLNRVGSFGCGRSRFTLTWWHCRVESRRVAVERAIEHAIAVKGFSKRQ